MNGSFSATSRGREQVAQMMILLDRLTASTADHQTARDEAYFAKRDHGAQAETYLRDKLAEAHSFERTRIARLALWYLTKPSPSKD